MNAGRGIGMLLLALGCRAVIGFAAAPGPSALPVPDTRPAVNPELASDGRGNFLLVWQQGRNYFEQQDADIYALRLDAAGRPLGAPIPVCVEKGSQERPRIAFADGVFVVVWHDLRNGRDWDVHAARIGADGTVRDPGGFVVAGGSANQASPEIATVRGGVLAVWQHYAGRHYEVHGTVIGATGKPAAPRRLSFGGEALHGGDLSLASLGATAMLAWKDERNWRAGTVEGIITRYFARARVDDKGIEVLDVERAPTPALGRQEGRFASDRAGSALYVAWGDIGRGRLVPVAGLFDPRSAVVRDNSNAEGEAGISAWDPRKALAPFSTRMQIPGPVAAAYGDGVILLAASEAPSAKPPYTSRLLAARLSSTGQRLDEPGKVAVLHETGSPVANPALAAGPEGFVLVFQQDDGPGQQRLFAKIVRLR